MTASVTSRGCRPCSISILSGTSITDAGLSVLASLPQLRTISLAWTRVTDEGIGALAHCHALERVNLWPQPPPVTARSGRSRANAICTISRSP